MFSRRGKKKLLMVESHGNLPPQPRYASYHCHLQARIKLTCVKYDGKSLLVACACKYLKATTKRNPEWLIKQNPSSRVDPLPNTSLEEHVYLLKVPVRL